MATMTSGEHQRASARWQRVDDHIGTPIEGGFVILDINAGQYFWFNASAAAIWDLLREPRTDAEIVASLVAAYKVTPEHCAQSLHVLMEDLRARNLIKKTD